MNKNFILSVSLIAVLFAGCTPHKKLVYLSNLDTTSLEQFFPLEKPDYTIQYQDILYVNIFTLNEEMNNLLNPISRQYAQNLYRDESSIYIFGYTVSDSGFITLPILGDIYVVGSTIEEIRNSVQSRARNFLKDAVINVKLLSFKFTVMGEVNRPGTYTNFNNQLTVLDAIGMAGDITDYGNRERILIVRPTKDGTHTYRINVQDNKLLVSEGYFLLPNDIVIVEPIKSKSFRINIPTMTLVLASITTLILFLNFFNQ